MTATLIADIFEKDQRLGGKASRQSYKLVPERKLLNLVIPAIF